MAYAPDGGGGAPKLPKVTFSTSVTSSGGGGGAQSSEARRNKRKTVRAAKKVRGSDGENLVANDASGFGLTRPYLGWNTYPTSQETPVLTTTSGTFVALATVAGEPQHPKIRVRVRAVTGAATSGEVRLVDRLTGTVVAGPLAVGLATTVESNLDGPLVAPVLAGAGAAMKIDVEVRRTAGASTIGVLVLYAIGIGT